MMQGSVSLVLVCSLVLAATCHAWYIPGVTPYSYRQGEDIAIKVNALTSTEGIMPYPFYSVRTCTPRKEDIARLRKRENLGEVLSGEQIEPSLYFGQMRVNISCSDVCGVVKYTDKEMAVLADRIEQQYKGNMVLDNLPVAQEFKNTAMQPHLMTGYPLGLPKRLTAEKKAAQINNHLAFTIGFHTPDYQDDSEVEKYRIVYFYARPASVAWPNVEACKTGGSSAALGPVTTEAREVIYTYSIEWVEEPNVVWATRWDVYLKGGDAEGRIHWISIINSLIVIILLSTMVAMILMRTLHKDFNRYNNPENNDEAQEETGWKLVHGDVFRTPPNATLLVTQIAAGSQLIGMTLWTLVFACAGFLSPSNRGGLVTASILLFALLGSYAGYVAARLFKMMGLQSWRRIFFVGLAFPGLFMSVYLFLNFFTWWHHASSAIPFKTLLLLVGLWLLVSLTLTVVGAAAGYKRGQVEFPCKVTGVGRLIPEGKWYFRPEVAVPVGGVLPFGAAFMELVFIFSSIWQGRVYYVFGFLAVVFIIVAVTCAEVSVVFTYFQLCYEDWQWWHRSYYVSASAGIHLLLYSAYYFHTALNVTHISSTVLYFGYSTMIAIGFGLVCGTVGWYATFWFVRKIYSSIKID